MNNIPLNQRLSETINKVLQEYKNDEYLITKISTYISNLENHILSLKKEKEQRDDRKNTLSLYKNVFMEHFLSEKIYYYIPDSTLFITYNNKNYTQINENTIWLEILTMITKNKTIMPWKHKIRVELIASVKKQLFIHCIPESHTIQLVLNIFSGIISANKDHSKFLLTIIGDSILKKNTNNTYLVDSKVNAFVNSLQFQINKFIRCNFTTSLKYKYYNHDYSTTRLIYSKDNIDKSLLWEHIIKQYIFDIIAVSCHYSNRFITADNFIINNCKNNDVQTYVLFLKNNTKKDIIDKFSSKMLQKCDSLYITFDEAFYIWKTYLKSLKMPPILFSKELFHHLGNIFRTSNDRFIGVTSPKLHYVKVFKQFMSDVVIINPNCTLSNNLTEQNSICDTSKNINTTHSESIITLDSFELSELHQLYSYWRDKYKVSASISEEIILSLLKHFYTSINIQQDKYILGCKSTIWNKEQDVVDFLTSNIIITSTASNYNTDIFHTPNLYQQYCDYVIKNNITFIVSKAYFKLCNTQLNS